MTILQFMVSGVGLLYIGKKERTIKAKTIANEKMLIASPYFPKLNTAGGNGAPVQRLQIIQPRQPRYAVSSAEVESDIMALSATEDPRLMSDRRQEITHVVIRALSGTSNP